jgi:hypothetical protein
MNGKRKWGIYTTHTFISILFAGKWMEVEIMMVSEITSSRKTSIVFSLICER